MRNRRTSWAWALATFFGTGFMWPGPGTWGSAAATLLWLAAAHFLHPSRVHLGVATTLAAIVITLVGIPASSIVSREAGKEDPGFVVLDEVAGQLVALIGATTRPIDWLLAFLLFRIFDILKPAPARQFDRIQSGFGIMMDDLAAGVYALILMGIVRHWLLR